VIEEVRRLTSRSSQEVVRKGKLGRGKPRLEEGKKKKQHSWRGARGKLQKIVWDPGGLQHGRRGAHEKELMNFPAVEYDAGASLHLSKFSNTQSFNEERERRQPSHIFKI